MRNNQVIKSVPILNVLKQKKKELQKTFDRVNAEYWMDSATIASAKNGALSVMYLSRTHAGKYSWSDVGSVMR